MEIRSTDRVKEWLWASHYWPWTFAGVQVALQAWKTGGTVISIAKMTGEEGCRAAGFDGWDAISATPTYFDLWTQKVSACGDSGQIMQVKFGEKRCDRHVEQGCERCFPACNSR